MKILHVTPHFVPAYRYGGGVVSIAFLCQALSVLGHRVTVFTTNLDGPRRLSRVMEPPAGLEAVEIRYFPGSGPHRLGFSCALAQALAPACVQADVVHVHGVYHFTTAATALVCRRLGVPYVVSPHGVLDPACVSLGWHPKRAYLALLGWRDLRGASSVHFSSDAERKKSAVWGVPFRPVVIPNCVAVQEFDALPPAGTFRQQHPEISSRPVILFLSLIAPKKGLDLVVRAVGELVRVGLDVHLAVVGPADDEKFFRRVRGWVRDERLDGRVTFTGLLTGPDKLAAFRDASVFVLPSLSENFGNSVVEAMACRIPVVISPHVDIATEIEEAGAGVIAERDPGKIAGAIGALLSDPSRCEEMGQRGRRFVEEAFNPGVVAARMTDAYEAAMRSGGSKADLAPAGVRP